MTRLLAALTVAFALSAATALTGALPLQAQTLPFGQLLGGESGGDSSGGEGNSGESGGGQPGEETADPQAQSSLPPDLARALAAALADPAMRQALIDELLRAADASGGTVADGETAGAEAETTGAETAAPTEEAEAARAEESDASVARRIAELTKGAAEDAVLLGRRLTDAFSAFVELATGQRAVNWPHLMEALTSLGIVAGATFLTWWIVGRLGQRLLTALASSATDRGWLGRILLLLGRALVDVLVILIAWGGGYGLALVLGDDGRMDINQSLFLNAFLLIEMSKVVLRVILSPRHGSLRLTGMSDETANYWYFWLSRLIGLLGYGLLLVVPLVSATLGWTVGNSLKVLIALAATLIAIAVILQNRASLRGALEAKAERLNGDLTARVLSFLGRVWHLVAVAYVLTLFGIWLARPFDALSFMLTATLESAVAVIVGVIVVALLTRAISGGLHLPDDLKRNLPLLERRLNAFVPGILKVVRVLVMIAVLIAIAEAWGIIAVVDWLASGLGREIAGRLLAATAILLAAFAIWMAVTSWIEYRLNAENGYAPTARLRTLLSLFRNALTIALLVIAVMLALSELGVNIGPLLAGAGVVGLAIGFGAQKLVQDIITGAFIQFENALNEGDVVTLAGLTGVVEKLTVRSVALRDLSGVYHLIPFSAVDSVSNFVKGFAYHLAEIGVAYREDIGEVKQVMQEAFDELKEGEKGGGILEPLEMHGVTQFGDSAVVVRARIKCRGGDQWAIGRAYNEIIKRRFDEAGIEIPFPHVTLYMGEDKEGGAPALRVRSQDVAKLIERNEDGAADPDVKDEKKPESDGPKAAEPSPGSRQDGPA
ncbi:mechanosensitive ion channel domain-containing protein [Algihabitans albus]|uniref:mechanosensitive ion channel domain-containing protein n=1 Tax=Algihabitans albus TaxID=2164067 RepID=UPI000E5CB974|nr:mechanosensitive ion channel domain-containing protein [Algihabitans albus]